MTTNKPYNPFLIAGYHSPDYFCDRETETAKIISALDNDRNISLMSPRRYGKTGLIRHVFYQLTEKESNIVCIYIDIYATQNLNDFVKLFAENVLGKVDDNLEKAMKRFAAFFKSFRPVLSYDSLSGQPELSVKIETETAHNSLQEVFSYLQQSGKRCYIAVDEFQQVAEYPEKGTEALLRSYIQFSTNVKFIFSGSRQHLMSEIFLSAKRPFYQSTQLMTLDVVTRERYYQFASFHFQKAGFTLSEACFDTVYTLFEGHTWYVQAVLNRLYEYRTNIDEQELVYYALHELLEENTYSYQELLNAYSSVQVNLLKAVAKEKIVTQINAGQFISKYGLKNVSSITRALNKLLEKELIYKSERGYMVYDRFLGIWLSKL
ncbi:AAA family ATPase [Microbacter margulisiae]|uniref:DNA-binding transcriptional ArsR family regulator n=1 Tax=Microbacter margulisiae TaxID=1350067 RepID=A0A7W5H333_9PORP|nr:ATP-binding protein [Microbacter margulisiae]MBB3188405.1 DNA-binding transcriptional ArsR family regulator [Microbacter margulisiae]